MEIIEAITSRKSIRGYKPDPVPRKVIQEILDAAIRAPSSTNAQQWKFIVVTGRVLDELRQNNIAKFEAGMEPRFDIPDLPHFGVYRDRQVVVAVQLFKSMGIAREDKARRDEWHKKGLRYFDAPAVIFLAIDRPMDEDRRSQFDMGTVAENICLAALHYGLGTCVQGQGVFWPDDVRRITGIPESRRLVIGITLGYPDWDFPANNIRTAREPVESITTWCGF